MKGIILRAGRSSGIEMLLATALLAAGISLLPFFDGAVLLTKPFWLDEQCCTLYPIYDSPSLLDLFANVRRSDVAPPLLHVVVWTVGKITGSLSPMVVRSTMVVIEALALLVLYATLRRRFGRLSSAAGTLAVASHTLVIHHAFDGRFYGLWLLVGVGYAWSLGLDRNLERSRRRDAAQALFAVCLCTIHWFGVTSLGLMAVAAAATHGRRWRDGLRFIAPSAAGPIALLAFVPMMLVQLRTGGEDLLWVPPLNTSQVMQMVWAFLLRVPVVLGVVLLLVDRLRSDGPRAPLRPVLLDPSMAALLAVALMPAVLIVISAVLNPVMVPRYSILAVLVAAPVVTLAAESVGRAGRGLMVALFIVLLVNRTGKEIRGTRYFDAVMSKYRSSLQQFKSANIPIVFQSYFIMYPVDGQQRGRSATRVLDLPDSTISALLPEAGMESRRAKLRLDRNQSRLHYRVFGFPIALTQAKLDSAPRFYLFARDADLAGGFADVVDLGQRLFPKHRGARVNEYVTLFTRAQ